MPWDAPQGGWAGSDASDLLGGLARRARSLPVWPLPALAVFFPAWAAAQESSGQRPGPSAADSASSGEDYHSETTTRQPPPPPQSPRAHSRADR
jgi:hypothetical protein